MIEYAEPTLGGVRLDRVADPRGGLHARSGAKGEPASGRDDPVMVSGRRADGNVGLVAAFAVDGATARRGARAPRTGRGVPRPLAGVEPHRAAEIASSSSPRIAAMSTLNVVFGIRWRRDSPAPAR